MSPVPLELPRPFVQRSDALRVGAVENLAPFAPHVDETDVAQHAQMLGYRGLRQPERVDDGADGPLAKREIVQDLTPPRLGDGVEGVGCGGRPRHNVIICLYRNMSSSPTALGWMIDLRGGAHPWTGSSRRRRAPLLVAGRRSAVSRLSRQRMGPADNRRYT